MLYGYAHTTVDQVHSVVIGAVVSNAKVVNFKVSDKHLPPAPNWHRFGAYKVLQGYYTDTVQRCIYTISI